MNEPCGGRLKNARVDRVAPFSRAANLSIQDEAASETTPEGFGELAFVPADDDGDSVHEGGLRLAQNFLKGADDLPLHLSVPALL